MPESINKFHLESECSECDYAISEKLYQKKHLHNFVADIDNELNSF